MARQQPGDRLGRYCSGKPVNTTNVIGVRPAEWLRLLGVHADVLRAGQIATDVNTPRAG
jgi:hypothetical protein